jgi:pseudaminic acid cytidylyltransferase
VIVAVIPARGDSKRIPRKNIRDFLGKPIIAYSIQAALDCKLFDRVVVSTDDPEIAETARAWGAQIPFLRPKDLAGDHTGTDAVVSHALSFMIEQGDSVSYACCIYATAPFVQPRYLREGYDKLVASGKDFAFSVTSFASPAQHALRLTARGVEAVSPEQVLARSQDLEVLYHDAAQFYWGRAQAYLDDVDPFSGTSSVPVVLPRHLVQDIDTVEDWRRAELMYRVLQRAGEIPP